MNSYLHWLLTFLLNSLWQVPLIALATIVAARLMSPASWRARHLLFIAGLLLAILLPAWSASTSTAKTGQSVAVSILPGIFDDSVTGQTTHRALSPRHYSTSLHIAPAVSDTVAFVYLAILLGQAAFLLWKWRATQILFHHAAPAELSGDLSSHWQRWRRSFNIGSVTLLVSEQVAGPVTLGFHRAALIVPPDFIATATREENAAAL